jgi:FMN-dependent NADH-azoreductase
MKLLHIDSAATGAGSVTRELTAAIVARWQDVVPGLSVPIATSTPSRCPT